MAIVNMDQLVSALSNSQRQTMFFPSVTSFSGSWVNLNQATTNSFGTMAVPTAIGSGGQAYNQSAISTGFPKWSAASGSNTTYLGLAQSTFATLGVLHVYDLLYAASGFSANTSSPQTITSPASLPSRNTTGAGAEIWLGCSSAIGSTATSITIQYTNSAGVSGRNTVAGGPPTSMASTRTIPQILQSGDTGVQSIQGMTLSTPTGTAGNLWVLVVRRVCSIGVPAANTLASADFASLGMPAFNDEACLLFNLFSSATSSGTILGQFNIIQG